MWDEALRESKMQLLHIWPKESRPTCGVWLVLESFLIWNLGFCQSAITSLFESSPKWNNATLTASEIDKIGASLLYEGKKYIGDNVWASDIIQICIRFSFSVLEFTLYKDLDGQVTWTWESGNKLQSQDAGRCHLKWCHADDLMMGTSQEISLDSRSNTPT